MSNSLGNEHFIRTAFEVALNRDCERSGDPARLANADYFNTNSDLSKVKSVVSYSIYIYNTVIKNDHYDHPAILDTEDYNRMDTIADDVINAPDIATINRLITEYRQKYLPIIPTPEYRAHLS